MGAGGSAGPGGGGFRVEVVRGETVDLVVLVERDGQALDIEGAQIEWRLYDCAQRDLTQASVGDGIEIADQQDPDTLGVFTIVLDADDTNHPAGEYTHEAWLELGAIRAAVIPPGPFVIGSARLLP